MESERQALQSIQHEAGERHLRSVRRRKPRRRPRSPWALPSPPGRGRASSVPRMQRNGRMLSQSTHLPWSSALVCRSPLLCTSLRSISWYLRSRSAKSHGPQGQSEGQQEAKLTCDQRVANIKADIKSCEEAKPKMRQKSKEIAESESKSTVQEQKQKARHRGQVGSTFPRPAKRRQLAADRRQP